MRGVMTKEAYCKLIIENSGQIPFMDLEVSRHGSQLARLEVTLKAVSVNEMKWLKEVVEYANRRRDESGIGATKAP